MSIPLLALRMSYKISTPMYEWDFKYNVQTQHTHTILNTLLTKLGTTTWWSKIYQQNYSTTIISDGKKIFCLRTFPTVVSLRLKTAIFFFFLQEAYLENTNLWQQHNQWTMEILIYCMIQQVLCFQQCFSLRLILKYAMNFSKFCSF